jgi:hypothetical protein
LAERVDDTAIARAAAIHLTRGAIWRQKPALAEGCEHDLRCLPSVEWRQTVLCAKCGGLDVALSQAVADFPGAFTVDEGGRITRKIAPGDPEATERLRAMEVPEDIIAQIVPAVSARGGV